MRPNDRCGTRPLVDEADRIQAALLRICRWMDLHGARRVAKNLATGANPKKLAEAEAKLGFSVPAELRALWSMHNGQRNSENAFIGSPRDGDLELELLSIKGAIWAIRMGLSVGE